jgi:predicted ATPase
VSKSSLSIRLWIGCLSLFLVSNASSQTDGLTKCACIDSLIEIDKQLVDTYLRRNKEVSESIQLENSKRFTQLHQGMKRISADCENQRTSKGICENESELLEREEEVQLILRVIEMNRRYFDE